MPMLTRLKPRRLSVSSCSKVVTGGCSSRETSASGKSSKRLVSLVKRRVICSELR
ncbi:hypothetical protein D3C78_1601400 [compost metagenome]